MNNIEELKGKIELAGKVLQNLVVVQNDSGKYKVIAGHRRRLASISLVEAGKPEYEFVPCVIEANEADAEVQAIREEIMLIATNSQREKTAWDKLEEARRTRALLEKIKKQEKIPGGLRDLVAKALHTSPAQIGRYDAILKNLSSEFIEEIKQDRINISTAYEISGLSIEEQQVAFSEYRDNGTISIKDARAKKIEEDPPTKEIAKPHCGTSLDDAPQKKKEAPVPEKEFERKGTIFDKNKCPMRGGYCDHGSVMQKQFVRGGNLNGCAGCCKICSDKFDCAFACEMFGKAEPKIIEPPEAEAPLPDSVLKPGARVFLSEDDGNFDEISNSVKVLKSLRDYCQSRDESETDGGSRVWALDVDALGVAIKIMEREGANE